MHMVQSGRYAATKNNVPTAHEWAMLEREVENFVVAGRKLDAKRRKRALTYSQENRMRLAKREKTLLNKIVKIMLVSGAVYTFYKLFGNDRDLWVDFKNITNSVVNKVPEEYRNQIADKFRVLKDTAKVYFPYLSKPVNVRTNAPIA